MRRLLSFAVLLLAVASARTAAPPASFFEKWTIDDVVLSESAGDFQTSPDGKFALWVKSTPDKDKNEQVGQVFRVDLRSHREIQLTRSSEACTNPRWSPDGSKCAFLSGRSSGKTKADEDKPQIWLLDSEGGEAWALTSGPRGVQLFGWSGPDALVFAAQEDPGWYESNRKAEKDSTDIVEDDRHEPPVRLFRVEVGSKKVIRISTNNDRIEQLAVSPDGKHAVTTHSRSLRFTYDNKVKPVLYLYETATGKRRQIFAAPKLNISSVRWQPDSKGFYATNEYNSKPQLVQAGVTELYHHDLATHKEVKLDLDWPRGLVTQQSNDHAPGIVPLADGFLALLADGIHHRAARYTRPPQSGKRRRQWLTGEHAARLYGLAASKDGKTLLYAHSTASTPTRWYHADLAGARIHTKSPIAGCNEHLANRRKARAEVVRWKGGLGDEVEGLLFHPPGRKAGAKAPLIVQIHGGPASADHDAWEERWSYAPNLLCQRGAFVLKVNYHGSSEYGLKWLESITNGRYAGPELDDVEKAVDFLIDRGLVDPDRLALQGWSNGAILSHALIARTTRYKAASAGAGAVEYISDWSSCEFGASFDSYYLGASPFEDLALYLKKSPFYRAGKVRTPTLLMFGTKDRVVHPQQGWAQYRALQQLGKAPVRYVRFPGEEHGLKKLSFQRRKLEEELAWFDRYLFGVEKKPDESLKKDSPLDWALKRARAKKVDGRYGVKRGGVLAPEVVPHAGLEVGRFEVTRAQYQQFDKDYAIEPGKENHPASGITFAQASAYCLWLSKQTGRSYRLPTEKEADSLYDKPEEGDNTLDRWAGYSVNPDDWSRLLEKSKVLGPGALLEEVGRGRGVGKSDLVYDLSGNVSEWVMGKDGKGLLRGGSADTPADRRGEIEPGPDYRGFRVVLE